MEQETLIRVENVSKKFSRSLKRSLWYGVTDTLSEFNLRKGTDLKEVQGSTARNLRKSEFVANEDISFEVKRGECLGLIGHNGAGKTTLLKMLNGLIKPDEGRIEMHGRVGALIALGAGFNPILTGRENLFVNGSILGFSHQEIREKFDQIVEFAEIEDAIDSPVRTYSSGMQMRLGFAVAINLDPDILLIDEVLAVGDAGFRAKCMRAIHEVMKKVAVIFVSHSMPQITALCSHAALMKDGRIVRYGSDLGGIAADYFSEFEGAESQDTVYADAILEQVAINGKVIASGEEASVAWGEKFSLDMSIHSDVPVENLVASIVVRNRENIGVFASFGEPFSMPKGDHVVNFTLPEMHLSQGPYSCVIGLNEMVPGEKPKPHSLYRETARFCVENENTIAIQANAIFQVPGDWSDRSASE